MPYFDDDGLLLGPSWYDGLDPNRKCRVCGCTDIDCSGCIERTGQACYWVEEDLCSACESEIDGPTMEDLGHEENERTWRECGYE